MGAEDELREPRAASAWERGELAAPPPVTRAPGRCSHDRCDFRGAHIHVSELETVRYWRDR